MVKFIVGITGGSGVGKTTLINGIVDQFKGSIAQISLDNYYLPIENQQKDEKGVVNFDLPTSLDAAALQRDVELLLQNKTVSLKKYHFNHPEKTPEIINIEPKPILIIEGLFVMHFTFLREILDYSVFITVESELQLFRRLKRDIEERNYTKKDIMYQWDHHVMPAYKKYIEPFKSSVDLIISNNDKFDENILILEAKLRDALSH
jgi:uridine kinase